MTDLRTAAQQALEALEWISAQKTGGMIQRKATEPITALGAALAEPQDTDFERWWDDALDGPTPMAPISKETARWIWNAARAEPVQEPDPWGAGYEAGYAAGVAEYDPQPPQQALVEADRIMGHADEATEWRERWGHLFEGLPQRPSEPVQEPVAQRTLTDEVIAELWHKNGGFHHHFARHIERWLKGTP